MAITRPKNQILWATATSKSVAFGANETSDLITLGVTAIDATITLKADNAGTPASGDTVDFFVILSSGDPDGADVTDEFASADTTHARFLGQIDTNVTDPGLITVPYPAFPIVGKIVAFNNSSARNATVSAVIEEIVT